MKSNFLNDPTNVFVIAEAGSNWKCGNFEEDLKQAKKLIKVASEAGANAIKFQTYKADTVYVENAGKSKYLSEQGINQKINEIFDHHSMPYEMISVLADYCKKEKIEFMSTPFSVDDAIAVDPFVNIHKIASFEINHLRLIEFIAKMDKPVLISTGASTFEEIDFMINIMEKNKNKNLILLQCTSKYPAPLESLNLNAIVTLRNRYKLPIGFSDHSIDPIIAPITAVALGATVIEKHFTLDKNLPGPDHSFALNPSELKLMINSIRKTSKARGDGLKVILKEEKELQKYAKRSIQAIKDIQKGEILREKVNFDILRPGNRERGEEPRFIEKIEGKKSNQFIHKGDGVSQEKLV